MSVCEWFFPKRWNQQQTTKDRISVLHSFLPSHEEKLDLCECTELVRLHAPSTRQTTTTTTAPAQNNFYFLSLLVQTWCDSIRIFFSTFLSTIRTNFYSVIISRADFRRIVDDVVDGFRCRTNTHRQSLRIGFDFTCKFTEKNKEQRCNRKNKIKRQTLVRSFVATQSHIESIAEDSR